MHTRSRTRSVAVPRPPQSVAGLLPAEIVDCIFSHFDFDYSIGAPRKDRMDLTRNFSNMSVIAEGWKGPARRLLCRTVRIESWDQLAEGVPEWARGGLQNARIQAISWEEAQPHKAASALFKFFQHAPNLRVLRLTYPPVRSFDAGDSTLMRTTHFLPLLRDLTVDSHRQVPHSVIYDILATSDRQISRLDLWNDPDAVPPITGEPLDFGGNLRYLRVGGGGSECSSLDYLDPVPCSLVGLKEMWLDWIEGQPSDSMRETFAAVGPTLEKLTIDSGDVTGIVVSFPLLTRLTRLSLPSVPASLDSLLLPPSLVSLQFVSDDNLLPLLHRWTATPSLLPDTLQQINIRVVRDYQTFERLPRIVKLGTYYTSRLVGLLRHFAPRTLPFKTLEVYFDNYDLDEIEAVEAECKRLEVIFSRRMEDDWD